MIRTRVRSGGPTARPIALTLALALTGLLVLLWPAAAGAQLVISGNDNKALLVEGKLHIDPTGMQSVTIYDFGIYGPRVRATVAVLNSIFGPPTNVAITPDETLALVAEAVKIDPDAAEPKFVPSDKVHVIDLKAQPPRVIDTITVGKQPSGMDIHPSGKLAIVANRAETSVSVLKIDGKRVTFQGKVDTAQGVAHVVFTPDGRRAIVNHATEDKVSFLAIDGMTVTHTGPEIAVGDFPYNTDISPDGRIAVVANTGNNGRSDGKEDSVSVIDLEASPPRVIATLPAGDAPAAFRFRPFGRLVDTGNLGGSDAPPDADYYRERGYIVPFAVEGKRLRPLERIELGRVPEALAFSPDGRWLLVGNLKDADVAVLKVSGAELSDTGKTLDIPGNPGSMSATAR